MPQKLLTKAILKQLPKLYETEKQGDDAKVICKFFTPWSNWTWYVTEFDGEDTFFGLVEGHAIEMGKFSLSELQSIRGKWGLKIERDQWFDPMTLGELKAKLAEGKRP